MEGGRKVIINLRGTNGAGKSTIVHSILHCYDTITTIKYPADRGRKRRPLGYICARDTHRLFIPGHYEIANGGIDTIQDLNYVYELIFYHHKCGANVIYEGMNWSDSIERIIKMHEAGLDIRVIFIDLSAEECVAAVRHRGHRIDEKTIHRLHNKSNVEYKKLTRLEIPCHLLPRKEALEQVKMWLELE
jgi:thymidylate kinase